MTVQLQIYGGVGWVVDGRRDDVSGSMRRSVLVSLAENHGYTVSVDALLERLWDERPASGPNAVQRHVSALRKQLVNLGVDPAPIIESVPGGYRLSIAVVTDAQILEGLLASPDTSPEQLATIAWETESLQGVGRTAFSSYRIHLEGLAEKAFGRWAEHAVPSEVASRASMMLAHSPGNTTLQSASAAGTSEREEERVDVAGQQLMRRCVGLWAQSAGAEALDLLDDHQGVLTRDVSRRLCRWVIWLDPSDDWARYMLSLAVEECVAAPKQFERTIAAVDGRCFEEMADGRATAQSETEKASSLTTIIRGLRVEFMTGLSHPHDPRQEEVTAELGKLNNADAIVETARFTFLNLVRTGQFADAAAQLKHYEAQASRLWPLDGDDFGPMARASLRRSTNPGVAQAFGMQQPHLASAFHADRKLLAATNNVRRLILNTPTEPITDPEFFEGASGMSPSASAAMYLLRNMHSGKPIIDVAHKLADQLPSTARDKQFHLLPIALGLAAEALRDTSLAKAAIQALRPWEDQVLGMWPIDYVFGPADGWLVRFDNVSPCGGSTPKSPTDQPKAPTT